MLPSRQFLTITHSIDAGSWFPTRHRDRVNHATRLARVGAQVFDWTPAAAIAGGEQHQSLAPGTAVRGPCFPVTQPIALAFACPSHAAPRPRSADWSSRLWQRTDRKSVV